MTKRPSLALVVLVASGLCALALGHPSSLQAEPAPCDAIVGTWAWFTGATVTIRADHTMVYQGKLNDGTWKCQDSSRPLFTLKWRVGGFVNRVTLSPDGRNLTSADAAQSYVHATRVGVPPGGAPAMARGRAPGDRSASSGTQQVTRTESPTTNRRGSSANQSAVSVPGQIPGTPWGPTVGGASHTEAPAESGVSAGLRGAAAPGSAGGNDQTSGWDRDAVYRAREAELKQAIAAHPNDPDALVALASFYLKPLAPRMVKAADGKVHRVMVPLRNQILWRANDIHAGDNQMRWLFRGDPKAAFPLLQKALALNPHHARAIREMAMLYRMEQDLDHMRPYMEAALKNDPMDLDMVRLYMEHRTRLADVMEEQAAMLRGGHTWISYEDRPDGRYKITHHTPPSPADLARAKQLEAQAPEMRRDAYRALENLARAFSNDPRSKSDPRMAAEWRLATAIRAAWVGKWDAAGGTAIAALRDDPTYLDALDFVVTLLRYSLPSRNAQQFKATRGTYIALLDRWNGGDSTPIKGVIPIRPRH